jgi:O-antigen/teichoic acid export membrane protein
MQSYVVILGRLFSFDTWQAVIKFGAERNACDDLEGLRAVSSFAMLLDGVSTVTAGLIGLLVLFLVPQRLGVDPKLITAAAIYTCTLFVQLPGAPIGLMRLFDRFGWLTAISIGEAGLRFGASVALFMTQGPLAAYLYAFAAILGAANLLRILLSVRLLRNAAGGRASADIQDMRKVARAFMAFSAGSWVTSTLNVTRRDGTTLLVAALLGPAATGLYGLAVRIARPIRDLAELVRQAIFPDLSRLIADSKRETVLVVVRKVLVLTLPSAAAIGLLGIALGDRVIGLLAGPAYANAYWPLIFLITAAALYLCMPLLSSLVILCAGMRTYTLSAIAAGMIWAIAVVWPMLWWGLQGAAVGELVYVLAWLAINLIVLGPGRVKRVAARSSSWRQR